MATRVSDAGRNLNQVGNIRNLRAQMYDLQRQIGTQKKADTFSGLGTSSLQIQRLRADTREIETFVGNIDIAISRIKIMDTSFSRIESVAQEVLNGLQDIIKEGEVDMAALNILARESLNFLKDLYNTQQDGRYLFAGSDVTNPPLENPSELDSNVQSEISDWLDGSQDVSSFLASITSLTGTDAGYSSSITGAGNVNVRADKNLEVNYTVLANSSGFEQVIKAVSVIANISYPGGADVATGSEFFDVLTGIQNMLSTGLDNMQSQRFGMNRGLAIISKVEENHKEDIITIGNLVSRIEDADLAEAITKLQTVETQLTASYETTSLVNSLSLVNYL